MGAIANIRFRDIDQRELSEQKRLTDRIDQLKEILSKRKSLHADYADELNRLEAVKRHVGKDVGLGSELCDPLFVGTRECFNDANILDEVLANQVDGILKGIKRPANGGGQPGGLGDKDVVCVALTVGLLIIDGARAPAVTVATKTPHRIVPQTDAPEWDEFTKSFYVAVGDAQAMHKLACRVLPLLAQEGDPSVSSKQSHGSVDAAEFAKVMRDLHGHGITVEERQLRRRINESLDRIQGVGENRPITELGIDLPDLETDGDSDIVPDNVLLMGPMICAAMFDELKAFQVVDKLVELYQHGMLPIGSGDAGKLLYTYWKGAPNRMSEGERKNFYAITMGIPGGESGSMVNRDFNDLWLRFVSSVSSFVRQNEVDKLLRASLPAAVNHQQVRKAARDLASNLSLHGYGMAYYAAVDLQDQIGFMIKLLGDKEIRAAYGARDMWQVIDQVATLELGGAKTSSRYRTLASCGAIITAWLAKNVQKIMQPTGPIIDMDTVRSPPPRPSGQKATKDPTDYDLVNACELWLADTATSDTRVDEMAQPREAPVMTSKPVQIPAIARDMLEDVGGIGMGLGYGNTRH